MFPLTLRSGIQWSSVKVAVRLLILRRLFRSPEKIQPLLDLWASYDLIELQPFDEVVHAFKVLDTFVSINTTIPQSTLGMSCAQHVCSSTDSSCHAVSTRVHVETVPDMHVQTTPDMIGPKSATHA